jgi:hypothetical protein
MEDCASVGAKLTEYINHTLNEEEVSLVESHLSECDGCRQKLHQILEYSSDSQDDAVSDEQTDSSLSDESKDSPDTESQSKSQPQPQSSSDKDSETSGADSEKEDKQQPFSEPVSEDTSNQELISETGNQQTGESEYQPKELSSAELFPAKNQKFRLNLVIVLVFLVLFSFILFRVIQIYKNIAID